MIVDCTSTFFSTIDEKLESLPVISPGNVEFFNKFSEDIFVTIRTAENVMESSRENYFSNSAYNSSSFTSQQRDDFDVEIKKMLQNVGKRINELSEMVKAKGFARNATELGHFQGAVACLYQASKKPSTLFREFIEHGQALKLKLLKLMEMNQSRNKTQHPKSVSNPSPTVIELPQRKSHNPELDEQARVLLMRVSNKKDQIVETQQIITEINKILDETSNRVLQQQFQSSAFMKISEDSLGDIKKGNIDLVEANRYSKQAGKYWVWFFNILTLIILVLDFLKS